MGPIRATIRRLGELSFGRQIVLIAGIATALITTYLRSSSFLLVLLMLVIAIGAIIASAYFLSEPDDDPKHAQ